MPRFQKRIPENAIPEFLGKDDPAPESADSLVTFPGTDRDGGLDRMRPTYSWALDCDWVWQNLGGKMTRHKAGTSARWELWKQARDDMQGFVNTIMPKAMILLEKAMDKQGDSDVVVIKERKQIAELKQILADALEEAKNVRP